MQFFIYKLILSRSIHSGTLNHRMLYDVVLVVDPLNACCALVELALNALPSRNISVISTNNENCVLLSSSKRSPENIKFTYSNFSLAHISN